MSSTSLECEAECAIVVTSHLHNNKFTSEEAIAGFLELGSKIGYSGAHILEFELFSDEPTFTWIFREKLESFTVGEEFTIDFVEPRINFTSLHRSTP